MPSLNDVKLQIAGVGKTKQITKAMGMVASAKLRGAQNRIERFRPYAEKFGEMLGELAARTEEAAHPLLQVHEQPKAVQDTIRSVVKDGRIIGDTNPFAVNTAGMAAPKHKNMGRASMSRFTALSLSFMYLSAQ